MRPLACSNGRDFGQVYFMPACAEGREFNLILRYPVARVRQGSCNFCFPAAGMVKVKSEKYENLAPTPLATTRPLFVGELVCEFALCADPL